MAKKKQISEQEGQDLPVAANGAKIVDPSHLEPQAETGPPPRPEAVDPAHLKPQE